eukprot:GHVN01083518.1.p1 GENE.GHVN01083518.1~~GHVN01083518.1.p1  ORF type:complete len:135 (+),score=24.25 GHVN01083518.1:274-678(+)
MVVLCCDNPVCRYLTAPMYPYSHRPRNHVKVGDWLRLRNITQGVPVRDSSNLIRQSLLFGYGDQSNGPDFSITPLWDESLDVKERKSALSRHIIPSLREVVNNGRSFVYQGDSLDDLTAEAVSEVGDAVDMEMR